MALGAAAAGIVRTSASAGEGEVAARAIRLQGDPDPFVTFDLPNKPVMQDFVHLPSTRTFFVTQNAGGAGGSPEDTLISRVSSPDGRTLDVMKLVDGGHGLGFEIEMQGDQPVVWMTWAGHGWENDFVRFRYQPGTWRRDRANRELDLRLVPVQDRPEAVYHFDPVKNWAVERHFNWDPPSPSETYKRRRRSDILKGVDRTYGEVTLPASPPMTQGFATLGDTLFRWSGTTSTGNDVDQNDPPRLQQYDWRSGRLIGAKVYPDLSRNASGRWRDGVFEPQGMCVFREADGTMSLLLGDVTGDVGNRAWHVSKVNDIGGA